MKALLRALSVLTCASLLAGCAARGPVVDDPPVYETRALQRRAISEERVVGHPEIGVVSTASVGSNMTAVSRYVEQSAIDLQDGASGHADWFGTPMRITIMPGRMVAAGASVQSGVFYSAIAQVYYLDKRKGTYYLDNSVPGGIYVEDGKPFVFWKWNDHPLYVLPAGEARITKVMHVEARAAPALRRELVYGGISAGTVNILYREFLNDTARPAFSQELRYDLSQGSVIGYQAARFEILKADNLGITYRVISHLDGAPR